MQGFVIKNIRARSEDALLFVLTPEALHKAYRFYGARHPLVNPGSKIDFELERCSIYLPRLRSISSLAPSFAKIEQITAWQSFLELLYAHLNGVSELSSFYFSLLERLQTRLFSQNPKRACIDAYASLLAHEGRLGLFSCACCSKPLRHACSLGAQFAPSCCQMGMSFELALLEDFFASFNSSLLDDEQVNELYLLMLRGF